jgi:serpin B
LFFSPYSISTCLAMTYAGARGETEKQMSRVLHLAKAQPQVHSAFGALQRQLDEDGKEAGIQLSVANALWAQEGHPFRPDFLQLVQGRYSASLKQTNFKTDAETARVEINRWVTRQTQDKIQDILSPGSLGLYTRLVLANAIYFKGKWAAPFVPRETSLLPFHLTATRETPVPLMHHFDQVAYMENDEFQAVELPYVGKHLSMVILLPRQVAGCSQMEDRLTLDLLSRSLASMKETRVELFIPKFKMESGFGLAETLARMGMGDAFNTNADFTGLDGTRTLFISTVSHRAWVEVKEEGTEAAAATAVRVAASAVAPPPPPTPVFRADHPFIFLIRETQSGSVLFLGRLADPQ